MPKVRQRKRPFPLPRPGNIPGSDRYDVKSVLDYRFSEDPSNTGQKIVHFLVEWAGYALEKSTWENAENLLESWHVIKEFLKKQGKQPQMNEETGKVGVVDLHFGQ